MKPLVVTEFGESKPPRLALLVSERLDPPGRDWSRYWVLRANVVSIADDETPRNISFGVGRQPLAGFGIRAQQDAERAKRAVAEGDRYAFDPYGAEIVWDADSTLTLDAREAEIVASTHRTLARRMATVAKATGEPRDCVAFVLAAALAMGISTFVFTRTHGADGTYSSGTYLMLNAAEAASKIDSMIAAANAALREA